MTPYEFFAPLVVLGVALALVGAFHLYDRRWGGQRIIRRPSDDQDGAA